MSIPVWFANIKPRTWAVLDINMMIKPIQKYRNKLNGIIYYKSRTNVKFVEGEKYVQVFRYVCDKNPVWVRADVLEEVTS